MSIILITGFWLTKYFFKKFDYRMMKQSLVIIYHKIFPEVLILEYIEIDFVYIKHVYFENLLIIKEVKENIPGKQQTEICISVIR